MKEHVYTVESLLAEIGRLVTLSGYSLEDLQRYGPQYNLSAHAMRCWDELAALLWLMDGEVDL